MAYDSHDETFEATARFKATGSSFVREVAHDQDTNELLVVLDSGKYLYENVPVSAFRGFENAHSKGQYYNNWIKRGGYGFAEEVYAEIVDKATPAPDMGPIVSSVTGPGGSFFTQSSGATFLSLTPAVEAKRSHRVDFTVDSGNEVKSYNVEASGVDEAVDTLNEVGDSLGLTFTVKGVYVKFND